MKTETVLKRIHILFTIVAAGAAVVLGVLTYSLNVKAARLEKELATREETQRVEGLLDGAWKLMGGHHGRGTILEFNRDPDDLENAHGQIQKALKLRPESSRAHRLYGVYLGVMRRYEEAAAEFRKAITLNPENAANHISLGIALGHQGQGGGAIAEFVKATQLEPKKAVAFENLGIALTQRQMLLSEAAEAFEKAIFLGPKRAETYCRLASVLKELGKKEKASQAAKKCRELTKGGQGSD